MEAIDFMNQSLYSKQPGSASDITSHPKFVLIRPDGTILYSDMSNDGREISISGNRVICTEHQHYMAKLVENYFPEKKELAKKINQGNVYAPIFEFLGEGNIIFNNITTYEGVMFFLHGIHGQLLIPDSPTDNQNEALAQLEPYVNYFREIEVKEYHDVNQNIKSSYYDDGATAIKNYFLRNQQLEKAKH